MGKKKAKKKAAKKVAKRKFAKKKAVEPVGGTPKLPQEPKKKKKGARKRTKGTCFVMMPFKEPFDGYYEVIIEPAVRGAHLDPKRADSLFRPSPIVADIWKMVQAAKVLLADVTTKNPNVFYELGLAHAVGKPVVLISETIDDVPFDLQQLRVILYDKSDPAWGQKLKTDIVSALNGTLDTPTESVPDMFRAKVKSQAPPQDATAARVDALERQLTEFISRHPRRSPSSSFELRREFAASAEQLARITGGAPSLRLVHTIRKYQNMGLDTDEIHATLREFFPSSTVSSLMKRNSRD